MAVLNYCHNNEHYSGTLKLTNMLAILIGLIFALVVDAIRQEKKLKELLEKKADS